MRKRRLTVNSLADKLTPQPNKASSLNVNAIFQFQRNYACRQMHKSSKKSLCTRIEVDPVTNRETFFTFFCGPQAPFTRLPACNKSIQFFFIVEPRSERASKSVPMRKRVCVCVCVRGFECLRVFVCVYACEVSVCVCVCV